MRVFEPGRPLVVEIGQGARFQDRRRPRVHRDDAVGIARHHLRHRSTRSGGFSHASRNPFSRRAASPIVTAALAGFDRIVIAPGAAYPARSGARYGCRGTTVWSGSGPLKPLLWQNEAALPGGSKCPIIRNYDKLTM